MNYLKYNCYDLAELNNELFAVGGKLRDMFDELARIFNSLDPQIKSYESLQNSITTSNTAAAEIVMRILSAYNALDQIIDVYYAAENNALRLAERLPSRLGVGDRGTTVGGTDIVKPSKIATAAINNSDLILEDWLAELIYKHGIEESVE